MTSIKKLSFWLCIALIILIPLGPLPFWLTNIGQTAPTLSAELSHAPDGTLVSSPKAQARHSLALPMRLVRMMFYPLLMLSFQLSGGAVALRGRIEKYVAPLRWPVWIKGKWLARFIPVAWKQHLTGTDILITLLFILIFNLAIFLLYLPFNFYRGFILAHQFGLSTQTAPGWLGDWGKSVLIELLISGLLWSGFYGLMRLFPRRWPVLGGGLLMLFSFIFVLLIPIFITPLFFEVRPLADPTLRKRILTLANQVGMHVEDVFVIDASSKTTSVNAYITGFGNARRIVLYDTLLNDDYTADEVELVLAHEMGHWYYRHVFWSILGMGAVAWLGLFGLNWLLRHTWQRLGLRSPTDVAGLPFILALIYLGTVLSFPFQNGISRYGESQADWFALTTTQNPSAFTSLFEQFAEQNLSLVNPPTWEKFIFYTHPPVVERIEMADKFK